MGPVDVAEASRNLSRLIEDVRRSHEPQAIAAEGGDAVLVSAEDWRAVQESLFLLSVPGMRESIREGLATQVKDCADEPGW